MVSLNEFGLMLRKRAHWTQRIIQRSMILQLGVMEETITDMHLFAIADEYNENVITRKFNRREEGAISGADWLWIIGEPGSWLPLLIQAKVINPKTKNCQHFDYKNGEQRKRLLRYARRHAFVPLYCIYNYVPSDFVPPVHLARDGRLNEDWACSFLSLRAVRMLSQAGTKSQRDILKYCIPWMDPFCLASSYSAPNGASIASAFTDIRDEFGKTSIKKIARKTTLTAPMQKRTNWENIDTVQAIRPEIPRTICNWFNGSPSEFSKAPLTGASIISTVPINQIKELNRWKSY